MRKTRPPHPPAGGTCPSGAASQPQQNGPVVRSETRLVRVDVIVTDKKGHYIHDLTANDFKVYDDNKQQEVANFSFGADPNSPAAGERRYTILFFDDSSMDASDQPRARAAAVKFIDANVGSRPGAGDRGIYRRFANHSKFCDRRRQTEASGVRHPELFHLYQPSVPDGDQRSARLNRSLRSIRLKTTLARIACCCRSGFSAKNLAGVAGRKSLVLFTAGFPLTPERDSELTATIDACNKANVAIYPLDVRGLVAMNKFKPRGEAAGSLEAALRSSGLD